MSTTLKEWCQAEKGRLAKIARFTGVSTTTAFNWKEGKKIPIPKRACQIEAFTNGEVSRKTIRPNDWFLIWPELEGAKEMIKKEKEKNLPHPLRRDSDRKNFPEYFEE